MVSWDKFFIFRVSEVILNKEILVIGKELKLKNVISSKITIYRGKDKLNRKANQGLNTAFSNGQ